MNEIWTPCEGAGAPGHPFAPSMMCSMCGCLFEPTDVMPPHNRDDIIARIDRGDFG